MIDPFIVIGVFMLGASAGALLTNVRHRSLLNRCEELLRGIYDTSTDRRSTEARGARSGTTYQLRAQPMLVTESKGYLNRHRLQRSVPGTSGLNGPHETEGYGDQRLAQ